MSARRRLPHAGSRTTRRALGHARTTEAFSAALNDGSHESRAELQLLVAAPVATRTAFNSALELHLHCRHINELSANNQQPTSLTAELYRSVEASVVAALLRAVAKCAHTYWSVILLRIHRVIVDQPVPTASGPTAKQQAAKRRTCVGAHQPPPTHTLASTMQNDSNARATGPFSARRGGVAFAVKLPLITWRTELEHASSNPLGTWSGLKRG